jgi:hypothetical protein
LLGGVHIIMFQPRARICVPANPLRSGSHKRSKESIATVRHLYPDFDIEGEAPLTSPRASDTVPTPIAFLSTSLGKYQMLCRDDSFTFEQESTLKLFAIPFDGDLACTDCDRVLRIPGFRNCKYDPTYPVTVTYPCDSTSNPDDFRLDIPAANAMLLPHAIPWRKHSDHHTNSEHDWAWILHEFAHREDAAAVTRTLAPRRPDIPRPYYSVQRAADVASARLCRIEGIPMKDVVTLRVVRRRLGIASAQRIRKGPGKRARRRRLQRTLHLGWTPRLL